MPTTAPDAITIASRYLGAWNEPDAALRIERLAALIALECRYADAHVAELLEGRSAFLAFADMFRTQLPDLRLEFRGAADGRFGWFRMPWRLVRPDGGVFSQGTYVGEIDAEGRIARLYGFMDS